MMKVHSRRTKIKGRYYESNMYKEHVAAAFASPEVHDPDANAIPYAAYPPSVPSVGTLPEVPMDVEDGKTKSPVHNVYPDFHGFFQTKPGSGAVYIPK